jgi:hypothetical protein
VPIQLWQNVAWHAYLYGLFRDEFHGSDQEVFPSAILRGDGYIKIKCVGQERLLSGDLPDLYLSALNDFKLGFTTERRDMPG